jgi:arylsulfatase
MWFAAHDAHRRWNAGPFAGKNDPRNVRVPPYLADTPETREDLAQHFDEISRLDHHVGEVVTELARQGVRDNTLVIFMADNGRPFPRSKTHLYDDGIKTPLILNWPAVIKGAATVASLVSSIDLMPTLLELAGVPVPPTAQGVSLRPILRDPGATIRDCVFAEKNWQNFPAHMRMVRAGDWVYLRNAWPELPQPGASDSFYNPSADALKALHAAGRLTEAQANIFLVPRPTEELYHVKTDPAQTRNLVHEPRAREELDQLRALLTRWQQETGDSVPENRTPANVDYETGRKLELRRGDAPGSARGARHINHPGPIRAGR